MSIPIKAPDKFVIEVDVESRCFCCSRLGKTPRSPEETNTDDRIRSKAVEVFNAEPVIQEPPRWRVFKRSEASIKSQK